MEGSPVEGQSGNTGEICPLGRRCESWGMFLSRLFFLYLFIFYFTSFRPYIISTMRIIFLFLSQPYIPCCNEGLDVSKDVKRTNHCSSPSFDIVSMICKQSFVSSTGADEDIPCGC